MIRNKHQELQMCKKHKLPLYILNPDRENPNEFLVCIDCFMKYHKAITISEIQQSNQRLIDEFEQQLKQNSNIWKDLINDLTSLKEAFLKSIEKIQNIIDVIMNQIHQTSNEFENININHIDGVKIAHQSYSQNQLSHKINIIQQIESLRQSSSIDKIIKELNAICVEKLNYDDKLYEYQLIPELSIKQENSCGAISFNYDGSIIVAGCDNIIKVFEFKNIQLKEVQTLQGHTVRVSCLKFMNKSNQFISGDFDDTITTLKIWQVNNNNQWDSIQTLKGHKDWISCLIISQKDDLIVSGSGSRDQSIIFWRLNDNEWQLNQQIVCSSIVWSLSFNESNTKLASCEDDKLILVFQQQRNQWILSQKIQVETEGMRLCFISDDQFVFLPWRSKYVQFYKFDQLTNKFEIYYDVQASTNIYDDAGFPIKFIKSKNLLIVKNCEFINNYMRSGNQDFIQIQKIQFQTPILQGGTSEDGNFMVTWDSHTKNIKQDIQRKLSEIFCIRTQIFNIIFLQRILDISQDIENFSILTKYLVMLQAQMFKLSSYKNIIEIKCHFNQFFKSKFKQQFFILFLHASQISITDIIAYPNIIKININQMCKKKSESLIAIKGSQVISEINLANKFFIMFFMYLSFCLLYKGLLFIQFYMEKYQFTDL